MAFRVPGEFHEDKMRQHQAGPLQAKPGQARSSQRNGNDTIPVCPKYRSTVKTLDLGITIQTMMPDDVHLFLNDLPSMSIDYIVKQL